MKHFLIKDRASKGVMNNVYEYFNDHLPEYQVINVVKKSDFPQDKYLYMVVGLNRSEENPTFTVWTSWNESTKSLNHGHYGIEDPRKVKELLSDFYDEDFDGDRSMPMIGDRVEIFLTDLRGRGEIVGKDEDGFWDVLVDGEEIPDTIGESEFEIID